MAWLFLRTRPAPPVQLQDVTSIRQWRVVRLREGAVVLVGVVATPSNGLLTVRVSSPISVVGNLARAVQTTSGRRYSLQGPPARNARMRKLLTRWLADCGHGDAVDTTEGLWRQTESATRH
jgi:hypothetical protein